MGAIKFFFKSPICEVVGKFRSFLTLGLLTLVCVFVFKNKIMIVPYYLRECVKYNIPYSTLL